MAYCAHRRVVVWDEGLSLKTRRREALLGELQQALEQASTSESSAQPKTSAPEAQSTERHLHLKPGLLLIPSAPARQPSRAGKGISKRVMGRRLSTLHWVGLCLLALAMLFSLLQVAGLRPAQQVLLAFQTGPVGSFLLPPTPTPTPKPARPTPPPPPGSAVVISMIQSVFGSYSTAALAVARCESDYNASAVNPISIGGSHASGVFQILYPSTWDTTSQAANSPFDAQANILAAYEIFKRDGYSWREWQCKP
jgi:hypothetical protein